jgi:hypothetical protein
MFVAIADFAAGQPGTPAELGALTTEGTVLAIVQLVSAALLIVAGIRALTRRTRTAWVLLLAGHGLQVILTGYWFIRLQGLASDVPGPDPGQVFSTFALLFAAAPLVGLGLVLAGPGRRWFETASA